jgi:hypothetical protein
MSPKTVASPRPLWTCPKCNRQFVTPNMPHSCGKFSVEQFLAGKSEHAVALYQRFAELINHCGSVQIAPAKTRVGFQVRMIFAAINKLNDNGLHAHVVLTRQLKSPRFKRIEMMYRKCYVHHFVIETIDELDDEVKSWLQEAYEVGTQKHLMRASKDQAKQ